MTRILKYSLIFSLIFSFLTFLGYKLDRFFDIFTSNNILVFVFSLIFSFLLCFLFLKYLPWLNNKIEKVKLYKKIENIFFKDEKRCFFNCLIFILICYIPAFLAYFPGVFTYDVIWEADFFIKHDYIEIHPITHCFLVYLTLILSSFLKSSTIAIFLHVFFQMLVLACVFSYCIFIFSKYGINSFVKIFALLFFAFHPINQMFSLITTKDSLFGAFVLLFILLLIDLFNNQNRIKDNKYKICLIFTIFLMFLFRHNGFVAYILICPFLIYFLKKDIKSSLIVFLTPIILYFSFSILKNNIFEIKPPPIASSIGVLLQQMGLVRVRYDSELNKTEKLAFRQIVSENNELNYHPFCADSMKLNPKSSSLHSDFIENSIRKKPLLFVALYLKWGILHPKDYINAFLLNNHTYWYLPKKFLTMQEHYFLLTYNRWDNINGIPIKSYCFNPILRKIYDDIFLYNAFEKNPVSFLMFSMAFNFWFVLFSFFVLFYKKQYNIIVPLLIIPALFLTVLFGPISLLRYIYQNYLIVPILFAGVFSAFKKQD